jgi:hypothetical protein
MPVEVVEDPRAAVRAGLRLAGPAGAVLVTGSLFLVGEAYAELGHRLFEPWNAPETGGRQAAL